MTPQARAADKTHFADYQDLDGFWYPIIKNVTMKAAMTAARKFREQNPEMETRVR